MLGTDCVLKEESSAVRHFEHPYHTMETNKKWLHQHIQNAEQAGILRTRHTVSELAELILPIIQDGKSKLHIVADFDMTLTQYWIKSAESDKLVRNASSHAIVMQSPLFPLEAVKATQVLFEKFYPIEIDPHVTRDEKLRAMEEWWAAAHVILEESGLTEDNIFTMVQQSAIVLRQGTREMIMQICKPNDIPIIVFSAGLSNVIEDVFLQHGLVGDHIHIISNKIIFEDGKIVRVDPDPPIHVLNKSEASLLHLPDHDALEGRPNVVLMGDAQGDVHMADGVEHDSKLTIGFLHVKVEQNMPLYLETFDVVLLKDPPMEWINAIIEKCL
jgi:HAD superfamily hydrolase (TIGR01544 family)